MSKPTVVYEDEYFLAQIDLREGLVFFHVDVRKELTKSVIIEARKSFKEVKDKVYDMGHDRMYALTPSGHFARLLGRGFEVIPLEGVGDMELLVWELEDLNNGC